MRDIITTAKWTGVAIILALAILLLVSAPASFPVKRIVTIPAGSNLATVTDTLVSNNVVLWPPVFKVLAKLTRSDNALVAGDYMFERPLSTLEVLWRLHTGLFGIPLVRITVPEGATAETIGKTLAKKLLNFDQAAWLRAAKAREGYLFPDTYFFRASARPTAVRLEMERNFLSKIEDLRPAIASSTRSFTDVLIMASIIEKEANTKVSRRMVAGILWKRFDAKKRLEVDVATSTYRSLGLPPAPIANPGLDAIIAALEPKNSPYWFYVSDRYGQFHYAKTFAEHRQNIVNYLK